MRQGMALCQCACLAVEEGGARQAGGVIRGGIGVGALIHKDLAISMAEAEGSSARIWTNHGEQSKSGAEKGWLRNCDTRGNRDG